MGLWSGARALGGFPTTSTRETGGTAAERSPRRKFYHLDGYAPGFFSAARVRVHSRAHTPPSPPRPQGSPPTPTSLQTPPPGRPPFPPPTPPPPEVAALAFQAALPNPFLPPRSERGWRGLPGCMPTLESPWQRGWHFFCPRLTPVAGKYRRCSLDWIRLRPTLKIFTAGQRYPGPRGGASPDWGLG